MDNTDSSTGDGELISPEDLLARSVFYDTSFDGDIVTENTLLAFKGNSNPDGSFDESLDLERLTSESDIHRRGCKSAVERNQKLRIKREKKGLDPEPIRGEDWKYYCGYTLAKANDLKIAGEHYYVDLQLIAEDGNDAHVAIFLRPDGVPKVTGADRTKAGVLLAKAFKMGRPKICPEDQDDQHHPVIKRGPDVLLAKAI